MKFKTGVKRAEISNAIDQYVTGTIGEVRADCVPGGLCGLVHCLGQTFAVLLQKDFLEIVKIKIPSDPCHLSCRTLLKPQASASWVMNIRLVLYARASPAGYDIAIARTVHPSPGVSRGRIVY